MAYSSEDSSEEMSRVKPEYENTTIVWGMLERYEIVRKLGRGKYSEYFEGINVVDRQKCIIKVLKPVRTKIKIQIEISIVRKLSGGPNIIAFLDVVEDNLSQTSSLVFEYINNTDFRSLYPRFRESDIRFYIYELLKALEFCHSQGIMHRDIRPHNIMIDHENRKLRLTGWDMSEFYHEGAKYEIRGSLPPFKAPELLVYFQEYDYSVDMWSLGAMLASIILRRQPFFYGNTNMEQLIKIAKVLGTERLFDYLEKYNIELDEQYNNHLERGLFPQKSWHSFVNSENRKFVTDEAFDFLDQVLRYDHKERLTALEAMSHPFFEPVANR